MMKKILFIGLLLAIAGIVATGCGSCQSGNNKQEVVSNSDYDGVVKDFTAGVEHIIAVHRQTMNGIANGKYFSWYETKVLFNDILTMENIDDLHVVDVTDVFQTFSPDLCQTITSNVVKGTLIPAPVPDIWIEDFDMGVSEIILTVDDVLQRLKEWNGVLPESRGIVLRKPVGPQPCNPQYVIGNTSDVIFVDAVTGDITDWCPAFPRN